MKGRNELRICSAVMKEAMEYYLKNRVFSDDEFSVDSVSKEEESFLIKFSEETEKDEEGA